MEDIEALRAGRSPDWDPGDDNFAGLRDPCWVAELERLRTQCPVAYSDRFGGFYTLTRYADVIRAALEYKTFRSGQQFVRMPDLLTVPGRLNPPEHAVYRRMLNTYFTADRITALAPAVTRFAREQLAPILERGHGDAAREFCQPLPAKVLAATLNLGDDAYRELLGHFAQFDATGWDPDAVNEVIFGVFSRQISRLVAERRKQPLDPTRDLISGVMAMQIDGTPLPDETVVAIGVSMIGAGHSTTADALSSIVFRLATDPYLQSQLRGEPGLIPSAIEECLRLDAPLPELTRVTAVDVEVGGVVIPAGSLVALNFGAANLDQEEFAHPLAYIADRGPNRHLAFGHGVHKCVGAPLARLEMTVAIEQLLSGTRSFQLNGTYENSPGLVLKGIAKLPVRVTAA